MILSGLLGRSILASRSPELHEKEAQAQGMALRYDLYDFSARGWADSDLPLVLKRLQDQGYSGFNVTYPFKQAVVSLLDELDETAVSVGAVNTVSIRNGKLYGFNTDMAGFRDSVAEGLPGVALGNVVQLGAGGAGAAVANALLSLGVGTLQLVDVDEDRARLLAEDLASRFISARIIARTPDAVETAVADGIVNATPIGMNGKPGMPIDEAAVAARHWVADIIYFPPETELLRLARQRGCRTINGIGMVIGQAARAFEIITGRVADRSRMASSLG